MKKNEAKFVHLISLSHDWQRHHRKEFTKSLSKSVSDWSMVVCFEPPVSLFLFTLYKYPKKFFNWLFGRLGVREAEAGIIIFTPFMLTHFFLVSKNRWLASVEKKIIQFQFKRIFKKIGLFGAKKILWLILPDQVHLIGMADEDYLVYDCYDEYGFDSVTNLPIQNKLNDEINLIRQSDLVLNTSKSLYDKSIKYNENSHLVTNAANIDIFLKSLEPDTKIAEEMVNIRKPIIGYLGNFRNWIDFDLIRFLVDRNPDWSFVFIGQCAKDCRTILTEFNKKPNFFFLGYKEHVILPSYLKAFQVGLIPFAIKKITEAVVPYKLFEYLSAGIPVVTTPLPDLKQYGDYIEIAESKEEYLAAIKKLILQKNRNFEKRIKFAQENSYQARTDEINNLLLKIIKKQNKF
jgi:glycosyltransferase involved in cell wall biosynthesis